MNIGLVDAGGGAATGDSTTVGGIQTTDTSDSSSSSDSTDGTNTGDLINDVRAEVAGYDSQIEESAPGADSNDIEVTDVPGGTVVDPDTTNSENDLVGVTETTNSDGSETVTVRQQTDSGGVQTTQATSPAPDDQQQAQNQPQNQPAQTGTQTGNSQGSGALGDISPMVLVAGAAVIWYLVGGL